MATVMPTDQPVDNPPVRELGQLPTLDMEDIEFAQRAEEVTGRMPGWSDDLQLLAEANKTNAGIGKKFAFASKGFAEDAKSTVDLANAAVAGALAAGNFRGNWADQVGALNRPASVLHNNILWFLARDIANVAAEQPGVSSAWIDLMGRVTKVNGRTGDVTGLVEASGPIYTKATSMASAPLGQWASFNDGTGAGADWPTTLAISCWNVFTFGTALRKTQRATQVLDGAQQGWSFERQLHDATWSPWQRVIGDRSVIEKRVIVDARAASTVIDQKNGSIQTVVLYQNTSIVMPVPRDIGDQLTIEILPTGAFTANFSGVPVRLPVGAVLPPVAAWQRLMLTFIPRYDIGVWDMFIAGVHES